MDMQNTRETWLSIYQQLEARAKSLHDSQSVAFGILEFYDSLSIEQRAEIHPLLAEWFVSDDSRHRYDAAFLAGERRIRELAPAVEAAIAHLDGVPGPEAQDEIEDLKHTLTDLIGDAYEK